MKTIIASLVFVFVTYTLHAQIGIGTTSPNSTLDVRGSLSTKYTAFSANTTAGSSDYNLVFTGTSAAALTLPDATACQGRAYWIKNTSSNASVLTIATTSSQTVDGVASWSLTQTNKVICVVSNGTNWLVVSESLPGNSAGTPWINGGNNVSSQQNIGTTSNYNLPFITNNTEKMRLTSTGNLGIGTSTFNGTYPERLIVDAGSTGNTNYQNVIVGKGNTNSYAQLNIQNTNTGTGSSSDVVSTANNGTESVNYIDMGINGGGNTSSGVLGGANTAYLYSTGDDFVIGNSSNNKNLSFYTTTGAGTNTERMLINGTGNIGMGTSTFNGTNPEALVVDAGTNGGGAFQNVIVGKGNTNSYAQLNIQNGSTGTIASSDIVATANNGNESVNFVDIGINGSGNTSTGVLGGANTAYMYSTGNDFAIGNGSNSKNLNFFTTTGGWHITERMRVTSAGNVGIANTSPAEKLDVTGNLRFSGALMPAGDAGSVGEFLISTGSGSAPVWFNASGYAWLIDGNSVTSEKDFGTTSNYALPFITNGTERMRITNTGNVGIGTSVFNGTYPERLIVDAGSTGNTNYQNVIVGKGNTNSYAQLNIQNGSTGTGASSDVVATANNGSESVNYIDMGINGGSNSSSGVLGGANTAYLYATGSHFAIGNGTNSKDIVFFTTAAGTYTERMRITSGGDLIPSVNNSYDLGSSSFRWNTIYSQNVLNTSDARLKTNIRDLNYGLTTILNMHPVRYNWKEGTDKDNKIGFLAQELRSVIPEVVVGDESKENLAVNYIEIIPVLVNAIKEQQKQIDELNKKIKRLEKK